MVVRLEKREKVPIFVHIFILDPIKVLLINDATMIYQIFGEEVPLICLKPKMEKRKRKIPSSMHLRVLDIKSSWFFFSWLL